MDAPCRQPDFSCAGWLPGTHCWSCWKDVRTSSSQTNDTSTSEAQLTLCVSFCTCHCTFILWPLRLMNLAHVFMHVRHTQSAQPLSPSAAFFSPARALALIFFIQGFFFPGAHVTSPWGENLVKLSFPRGVKLLLNAECT
jgi:hypothetical protein